MPTDPMRLRRAIDAGNTESVAGMLRYDLGHGGANPVGMFAVPSRRGIVHAYTEHSEGLAEALDKVVRGEKRHSGAFFDRADLEGCVSKAIRENAYEVAGFACARRRGSQYVPRDTVVYTTTEEGRIDFVQDEMTGRIDTYETNGVKVSLTYDQTGRTRSGIVLKTAYPDYDAPHAMTRVRQGVSLDLLRRTGTYSGLDPLGRAVLVELCDPRHSTVTTYDYGRGVRLEGFGHDVAIDPDGCLFVDGLPDGAYDRLKGSVADDDPTLARDSMRVIANMHDELDRDRQRSRSRRRYADAPDDLMDDGADGPSVDLS